MDTIVEDEVLNVLEFSSRPTPDTSVLDRYRLDRDDDSPLGVKVVPNDFFSPPPPRRHFHRNSSRQRNTQSSSSKSPSNPKTSPAQWSNKRVYPKTPHPSKSKTLPPTIDENEPLDLAQVFLQIVGE
jgi:hypothetical protein